VRVQSLNNVIFSWRSLPNILSILRVLLAPIILLVILHQNWSLAFWLFLCAGLSDALDGALARIFNWQSELGGIIDPIADKVLLLSVVLPLAWVGKMPDWLAVAIVARDILIVGGLCLLRFLRVAWQIAPLAISKLNTLLQIFLILALLAPISGLETTSLWLQGLIIAVLISTIASGLAYLWQGLALLTKGEHSIKP
jgi:cardiolipin synthase (CMP-forming)